MKKILLMVPSLGMGGMERVCINYANLLTERGHHVTIINFTSHDQNLIKELSPKVRYLYNVNPKPHFVNAGIKNILKGNFRILDFLNWIKFHSAEYLYKQFVKDMYDVEIAFYGAMAIKIISGSTNKNATQIGWIHASTIEKHIRFFYSFKDAKAVYCKIQKLVCVSKLIENKLTELFERDNDVYTIYNPNNSNRIRELSKDVITDVKKSKFTFVTASRIDFDHKGLDRLIECIEMLNNDGFVFEFWIIGGAGEFDKLKKLVEEKKLSNIRLLGMQYNPYKYIANADMYVCSSRYEGFSMVMAEALILGKPMVVTDVSGSREMLGNSEYGLVVENSTEGIHSALKRMMTEKDLFEYYKIKAIERKDFLSEEKIINKLEKLF